MPFPGALPQTLTFRPVEARYKYPRPGTVAFFDAREADHGEVPSAVPAPVIGDSRRRRRGPDKLRPLGHEDALPMGDQPRAEALVPDRSRSPRGRVALFP